MGRSVVEARYEWNWSPLVGSVQGLLRALDLPHEAAWVSAALGEAFRVGGAATLDDQPAFRRTGSQPRPLDSLAADLASLGLRAEVVGGAPPQRGALGPWRRWRLGRRIRGRIRRGAPVVAFGAGRGPGGGPEFGLIVGCDEGRGRYRVNGPLMEESGRWLAGGWAWGVVVLAEAGSSAPGGVAARARRHALAADGPRDLERWRALLESETAIDAQGHAFWTQALAAARGEAARFWGAVAERAGGEVRLRDLAALSQAEAVTLSRFATLFPYPAGGDVQGLGGRRVGGLALGAALTQEREVVALLGEIDLAERAGR